jgi:hypothetical protein
MISQLSPRERKIIFQNNLIHIDTVEELNVNIVLKSLKNAGFCCIRGLISEDEIRASRKKFFSNFNAKSDNPSSGESPRDIQRNFQKLRVGISPAKPENSRLVRTFFNPMWEEDIFELHGVFRRMIHLRNHILCKPATFALDSVEEGLWTASRLQHYPPGGGFMSAHRDDLVIDAASAVGLEFLQLLLVLSQKGKDYLSGGGFIIKDNKFIDIEEETCLGDVILYDGDTVHGVDTIDPHKLLDLNTPLGRLVGFITLYKDLSAKYKA